MPEHLRQVSSARMLPKVSAALGAGAAIAPAATASRNERASIAYSQSDVSNGNSTLSPPRGVTTIEDRPPVRPVHSHGDAT